MDALVYDDGSIPGLRAALDGATFVRSPQEFRRAFDHQRCLVIDPVALPAGLLDPGSSALLVLSDDGLTGGWVASDLVARSTPAPVLAARVALWVAAKEHRARLVHDLRTPLGVMLGNCQLLGEQLLGPLNEKQVKAISALERQVERLVAMVDDVR